ncbi:GNAT family N-acetyltransferase [Nubsella zeaxanthinifaciens]|jgi:putative acetyltransferase|uniref:GNAT family N-acetyltransferase n=1 Tax=Nubsella zeaxanthinifaciens TaxID=392412 RepID=UPI000DE4E991|nr:GNAT family N-acetyltransferase [Nubsella zeaxanthinifaciens]
MAFSIKRTTSTHPDFVELVRHLDAELSEINGNDDAFYAQFNKIDKINHVVLIYDDETPIACGAIKQFSNAAMEVKRMFTLANYRGKGAASMLLQELENWTKELNYEKCVLETSKRQPDALALYGKNGYQIIPNYGQYIGVENSVCFEKFIA